MKYLEELNQDQLDAVKTTEGYLRVIAGAGTGKTKLLVSRYVYLVKSLNGNFYIRYKGHVIVFIEDKYNKKRWRYSIDGEFSKYSYESINEALKNAIENIG